MQVPPSGNGSCACPSVTSFVAEIRAAARVSTAGQERMDNQQHWSVTFTDREQAALLPMDPDPAPLGPREVAGRTRATLISAGTELAGAYQGSRFPAHPGYAAV